MISSPAGTGTTDAIAAVASACVGAQSIQVARNGGSRRALGKRVGIPHGIIADIEAAAFLPTPLYLKRLALALGKIDQAAFERAREFGSIPWDRAVVDVIAHRPGLQADSIAAAISQRWPACDPAWVSWRLKQQLARAHGAGALTLLGDGSWAIPEPELGLRPMVAAAAWQKPILTSRHNPEHDAFFHTEVEPGLRGVVLNKSHPAYEVLSWLLSDALETRTEDPDLGTRLTLVRELFKALLSGWADVEEGEKVGRPRDRIREIRKAWGRRTAEYLLATEEERQPE